MEAQPLTKSLHKKLTDANIKSFTLEFQGGSDEGYLYIDIDSDPNSDSDTEFIEQIIEDWAWSVYQYSGAGDGSDYGDTITYNLETNQVTTQEWYTQRTFDPEVSNDLQITDSSSS